MSPSQGEGRRFEPGSPLKIWFIINRMQASKNKTETFDEYIKNFPADVQEILEKIHGIIKKAAPEAEESISYGMPAFKMNGKPLVYFAAWKNHIGFYATPAGNEAFKKELAPYEGAKGSVKFPFDKPMPYDLIKKIAEYRVKEITSAAGGKY